MDEATPNGTPITQEWCTEHFDHLDPNLAGELPEALAHLRASCPVAHSDQRGGFWVVTRYEDVLRVAQDWQTFSSARGIAIPNPPTEIPPLPIMIDPPEQRIFKRLINPFLSPAAVTRNETETRAIVTRLVDDFVEAGECEFMDAFARPFPGLAFFELVLHAPPEEVREVNRLATNAANPTRADSRECMTQMTDWVRAFLDRRRTEPPRGDVVDAVLAADIDGRPINEKEAIGTVQLLIFGGLDTTAGALGHIMIRFCRNPEIPELLRARPELLEDAIEELVRLDSPLVFMGRTATRDVEVGGRTINAGDKVLVSFLSANYDEAEFDDAAVFDLERARNRQIAFGAGVHRCAGSNLARHNLSVALSEILHRLDDIRLQDGAEPLRLHSSFARAPHAVPIAFTPGTRVGVRAGPR